MRTSLLVFFIFLFTIVSAQEKVTLNGYLKDSLTGETLIGANILVTGEGRGVQLSLIHI